jgi:hypothetical protein
MLDSYEENIGNLTIRNRELASFWGRRVRKWEVSWAEFWAHFPEGVPEDVDVGLDLTSPAQRRVFQRAMNVVGSPEHVSVAAMDAAFPPGQCLKDTIARYPLHPISPTQISSIALVTGPHCRS